MDAIKTYGLHWPNVSCQLEVELWFIAQNGQYKDERGHTHGLGLFQHLMNARALCWPTRYRHRWTDLMYREFSKNIVTILMGCGSSQKTSHASEFALLKYWARPHETLVLVSTTTTDKLNGAIFAELKMLWQMAHEQYDFLDGHIIEHKYAIATDDIAEEGIRDMRKGIIGKACYVGRQYVGLGTYAGIKQKHIIFIADELQFMASTFLDCLPNMFTNMGEGKSVTIIGSGNPKHDPYDMLGRAAEPKLGWAAVKDIQKTTVWDTKFFNGRCINLIGTDSPNLDVPEGQREPYPGLLGRKTFQAVEAFWGKDSLEYYKQCVGKMMIGMIGNRVISKELCEQHHAFDKALWKDETRIKIGALDPAWGGVNSDRCVWITGEFGLSKDEIQILKVNEPVVVPILANINMIPDDQIAHYVQKAARSEGIPVENIFYDSTGRGTVGAAFARVFGGQVPNPVSFGDKPTERPVRHDLFVVDDGRKRHKTCREHYSKFVTELWFSTRMAIECDQIRELPQSVMMEGCMREYGTVMGNKIEVETKEDTMERMGCSPDCFVAGTMILTDDGEKPIETIKQGDMIVTPFGSSPVVALHESLTDAIHTRNFSNGRSLSGKGKHKIFTWEKGWIRLDELTIDIEVESVDNIGIWKILNTLFTKDERTEFKHLVDTIRITTDVPSRKDFYIGLSGLSTMEVFLKGCASITKMMTGEITGSKILNLFQKKNTQNTISQNDGIIQNNEKFSWQQELASLRKLLYGMEVQREESGTANTVRNHGKKENQQRWFASNVVPHLNLYGKVPYTAPIIACKKSNEKGLKKFIDFALFAAKNLLRRNITTRVIAPMDALLLPLQESRKVYNLTLQNHNVYYANGILVQNCYDAFSILVEAARQRGFQIKRLGAELIEKDDNNKWLAKKSQEVYQMLRSKHLAYAT